MSTAKESKLSQEILAWRDPSMDSVLGTETPKDPDKGYIALLGWSVNAIKAAQKVQSPLPCGRPGLGSGFLHSQQHPLPGMGFCSPERSLHGDR